MPTFEEALSEDDGAEALDEVSADGGQTADEGAADSGAETPNYLDLEANRDSYVKVTVDGEELDVPLNEALAGYSRQADYTRKTQEIAQQREQLQYAQALATAYERNPEETVRLLAQQAGISLTEARAQVQDAQEDTQGDDWLDEQADPRLSALEQRLQQFEMSQARTELERTIGTLQQRFGDDFKPNEVVNAAIAAGTTDLEGVYKQMAFDRLFARSAAEQDSEGARSAAEATAKAAKAAVGEAVQSGGSAAGAGGGAATTPTSIAEAIALAEAETGLSL